jgi:hypothetical protein
MKNLLKILLLSSALWSCNGNVNRDAASNDRDSSGITMPPDSALNNDHSGSNYPDPGEIDKETARQVTALLISSKQEINLLRSEVSDSLSKSGLAPERRSLLVKTIQQLESASDLVNKQLEQIFVTDLQSNRERLNGIVKKMKSSEKELGSIIARLDKISGYMQIATNLIQSLIPMPPATGAPKGSGGGKEK